MSEYPSNSTAKVYKDMDGNNITLRHLVQQEPEWAMIRIEQGEKAIADLSTLREAAQAVVDSADWSEGPEWIEVDKPLLDALANLTPSTMNRDPDSPYQ